MKMKMNIKKPQLTNKKGTMKTENLTIKKLLKSYEILQTILKICKANANYNWDDNMENAPEDEFKAMVKLIKDNQ